MEFSSLKKYSRLKWLIPVLSAGILTAFSLVPADDWQDKITNALALFNKRYPQEKVYLHFDKDFYASGETIWFKAYIMIQNQPSLTASNIYVELLDKDGNVVMKKRLPAAGAAAAGDFELPETLKTGQYQVRAYTAWMLNYDPEFLFYKNIEIFDPAKKSTLPSRDTAIARDFAVQFFPEGGNMLQNASGLIAFKAIDQNGYPIAIAGTVQNSKKQTVAEIKTVHDGMGSFELTPAAGESYKAIVKIATGQQKEIALPATQTEGAALKLYNRGSRIFYQASLANPDDSAYYRMMVIAQLQNQLIYKAVLDASEGRISGFIPTQSLPSGIIQVTLFSDKGQPLSERLAFVRKSDQIDISFMNAELSKDPRGKSSIELFAPDSVQTSMSISITDADQVLKDPDEHNIISNMLLTSDLKGYIYNPAWYFQDTTKERIQGLDLVMLTNGWRRFSWQKILNNDMPKIRFPYEQGMSLKGTAVTNTGRYPLVGGKVDFIFKQPLDSSTSFASVPTNDKGEFEVPNLQFMDTVLVFYQGNDKQKRWKDVQVTFEPHFFDKSPQVTLPYPMRVPEGLDIAAMSRFLNTASESNKVNRSMSNKTVYLKEVNIRDKKVTPQQTTEQRYTSGMFSSGDGYTFDLTKETPYQTNVFQYLQSKVAGLNITGDLNNPSMSWRGAKPSLYLNEMPADVSMLANVNVNDIALVKVFRPPFMGGFGGGAGGAIAVYTKKGGDNKGDETIRGFERMKKAGYSLVKEFYSPDYAVKKEVHALPDKRLTLFWSPYITVDSITHATTIRFYNNDFSKHFRIVVEGIAADGRVGRVEQVY
ncbi:MG2 domain-containing protein [Chitinophaga filiformis]|uniref:MG2 domain-containing protein n=1 Tax=Chitinophaga filiformis TaxID=104663 RepID=A0A1G7NF80_CHIFI|nr:MG2 domain-containing protein [Chitinophaga filiformis]SDF71959.1 MG2 domain-containing protein [Chitinophaga filiformis]